MQNNFPQELKHWFDVYECWWCKRNGADCLHHIVGRGGKNSTCESSILNAAPMCNNRCHLPNHALMRTDEQIKKLLAHTYSFLTNSGYVLKEIDVKFLEKYIQYY